jgi:N-acyl-D-amino-acid deacylase
MTGLLALMPPWVREGGIDETESMIKESANRKKIVEELKKPSLEWENIVYDSGMEGTLLAYSENYKMFEGKSISQIAKEVGRDPYKIMFEILEKDGCSAMVVVGGMCEEDVQCILKNHLSIVSSDGGITKFGEGKLHPRFYGTFPRIICKYVKEKRILTLEDAIRKMTSMPAWKLRLWDRGLIRPGMKADITVFDYWLIKDTSTFENPHSYPEGIKHVIINGKTVVEEGVHTGIRSGSILKRS